MAKKKEDDLKQNEYILTTEKKADMDKEPYVQLSLSDEKMSDIATVIMDVVEGVKDNKEREEFLKHLEYCRKRYTMTDLETDRPWEGAEKRRTGQTTIATDRLLPRIHKAIWGSGDVIGVVPEADNTEDNAKKQQKWLDYEFREKMELEDNSDNLEYDALMVNFGVLKNAWVRKEEKKVEITTYDTAEELLRNYPDLLEINEKTNNWKRPQYHKYLLKLTGLDTIEEVVSLMQEGSLPVGDKVMLRETYKEYTSKQKPEYCNPEDIIYPKGTTDAKKAWIIIHHLKMRKDELLRKEKDGFFKNVDSIIDDNEDDPSKEYDVYEALLNYEIKDGKLEEKIVCWVAPASKVDHAVDGHVFLRGIQYPFNHNRDYFILFRTTEHRYGFYKGGLGAKLKSVSKAEDSRVNMVANAFQIAVQPMWKRVKTANSPFDPDIHKMYAGAILDVADEKELSVFDTGNVNPSSFPLMNDIRNESQLLAGVSQAELSGMPSPKDPDAPAKKTELLLAETSINILGIVKHYVRGLEELAYQTQSNYHQLTSDTTSLEYRQDKGFEDISKQEIRKKAMFTAKHAIESVSAQEKARALVGYVAAIQDNPIYNENLSAQEFVFRTITENWDPELARNMDEIIPPGIKAMIEEQRKQAAAFAQQEEQKEQMEAQFKEMKAQGVSEDEIQALRREQAQGGAQ